MAYTKQKRKEFFWKNNKRRKQVFGKQLSVDDLDKMLPDEASAVAFVEKWRWKDGTPICPRCGSDRSYPRPKILGHRCLMCKKDYTVRLGSIFENSRLPLSKWIKAMCHLQQHRVGISTRGLAALLGVSQKTSWFLMHRLREICHIDPDKADKLKNRTSMDESSLGSKESNKHKNDRIEGTQGGAGKPSVIVAVEKDGDIRAQVIPDKTLKTIIEFARKHISGGTVIDTDLAGCFNLFGEIGYIHNTLNHSKGEHARDGASTNAAESFWNTMNRGFAGVYHYCLPPHLQRYVDEFSFRLTKGSNKLDSIDRIKNMIRAVDGHRLTYAALIRHPVWIHKSFRTGTEFKYDKNKDYGEPF